MSKYAENTTVPIDRSKAEIEKTLYRYGADQFMYATTNNRVRIVFRMNDLFVRFDLEMPDVNDPEYKKTPTGRIRRGESINEVYEKEMKRRWRALALAIKAKLEAVETGISSFEEEFLAKIVIPGDQTFGDWALPQIKEIYETGKIQKLLPGMSSL